MPPLPHIVDEVNSSTSANIPAPEAAPEAAAVGNNRGTIGAAGFVSGGLEG
jgi:hypothetical protein